MIRRLVQGLAMVTVTAILTGAYLLALVWVGVVRTR